MVCGETNQTYIRQPLFLSSIFYSPNLQENNCCLSSFEHFNKHMMICKSNKIKSAMIIAKRKKCLNFQFSPHFSFLVRSTVYLRILEWETGMASSNVYEFHFVPMFNYSWNFDFPQCSHICSTNRMGGKESVVPCTIEVENLKTRGSIRVKKVGLGGARWNIKGWAPLLFFFLPFSSIFK